MRNFGISGSPIISGSTAGNGMNKHDGKGLSFAKRIYLPRSLGLGIGFFSVLATLYPTHPSGWVWALLVFNGFIWPHVAYQLARLSRQPYQAERRNLIYDSLGGGFWAGAMGLSPLPTVTVLSMMAMNNIAAGGQRLFIYGSLAQAVGALVAILIFSPAFNPGSTPLQIYACLPMLVIYPLAVGLVSYQVAVKLSAHKHILSKLSRTDSFTGLLNHGSWKDLLHIEFGNCQTLERNTTIALIDIDHFKNINDSYGHIVGDTVLKLMSDALVRKLRDSDLIGRYGGDEFCVILPNTSRHQAHEIFERLRLAMNAHHDVLLPDLQIGLSVGIASYGPHLTDAAMWLHEADKALYSAKSNGRNQVVVATTESAQFAWSNPQLE
jgi:diguanylate cyclase